MDAHPIPQDVTSFQFKLIGDMTLKQFTYLSAGVGGAYIVYVFLSARIPLIAWPLIVMLSLTGAAFAFLPISERPLDHWVKSFFRSIFLPTQRRWQKKGVSAKDPLFANRLQMYCANLAQTTNSPKGGFFITVPTTPSFSPIQQPIRINQESQVVVGTTAPKSSSAVTEDLSSLVEAAKKAQTIQNKILEDEHKLNTIKTQAATTPNKEVFAKQFQDILIDLQSLTKQAQEVQKQMGVVTGEAAKSIAPVSRPVVAAKPTNLPTKLQKETPLTLTSTPNVINGIVTDSQGNYLEGVIVVAHDKEGLPVRALRTNKLGQFVAATPLSNGPYSLALEKDNLFFDQLNIELKGELVNPIKIAAKPIPVEPNPANAAVGGVING